MCTALWQPNFRLLQSGVQFICREDLLDEQGCIVPFATVQRPGLPDMRLQAQILNRPCAWVGPISTWTGTPHCIMLFQALCATAPGDKSDAGALTRCPAPFTRNVTHTRAHTHARVRQRTARELACATAPVVFADDGEWECARVQFRTLPDPPEPPSAQFMRSIHEHVLGPAGLSIARMGRLRDALVVQHAATMMSMAYVPAGHSQKLSCELQADVVLGFELTKHIATIGRQAPFSEAAARIRDQPGEAGVPARKAQGSDARSYKKRQGHAAQVSPQMSLGKNPQLNSAPHADAAAPAARHAPSSAPTPSDLPRGSDADTSTDGTEPSTSQGSDVAKRVKAHCDFPDLKGEDWQDLLYAELDHIRVRCLICCTFPHVGVPLNCSINLIANDRRDAGSDGGRIEPRMFIHISTWA